MTHNNTLRTDTMNYFNSQAAGGDEWAGLYEIFTTELDVVRIPAIVEGYDSTGAWIRFGSRVVGQVGLVLSSLGELTDVVETNPALRQGVFYDGSNWVNRAIEDEDIPSGIMRANQFATSFATAVSAIQNFSIGLENTFGATNTQANLVAGQRVSITGYTSGAVGQDIEIIASKGFAIGDYIYNHRDGSIVIGSRVKLGSSDDKIVAIGHGIGGDSVVIDASKQADTLSYNIDFSVDVDGNVETVGTITAEGDIKTEGRVL